MQIQQLEKVRLHSFQHHSVVFKMLNSGFGDNIVKTEFSEVPTMANGAETLSALASKDAEGNLYIALVNADRDRDRNIALQIEGTDVAGNKMTIPKAGNRFYYSCKYTGGAYSCAGYRRCRS